MINFCPINASPNDVRHSLHQPPEVALAILYAGEQFLLQLRDNIPTILYPGVWAMFGGHLEVGESPYGTVVREIQEEIGFTLTQPKYIAPYSDQYAIRHVFAHPLTVPLTELTLQEGWDFGLAPIADIKAGRFYSPVAKEVRSFGDRHQKILLDYIHNHHHEGG